MGNPHRGEVSFEDEGVTYTLSFSTHSLAKLENKLNMSVAKIARIATTPEEARLDLIIQMFWAALQDHHPGISMEEVDGMMRRQVPNQTSDLIGKVLMLTFQDAESDGKGGDVRPPQTATTAGNGKASSPPGNP